jgi:hypothetical protein
VILCLPFSSLLVASMAHSLTVKMDATLSSKVPVKFYQTAFHQIQKRVFFKMEINLPTSTFSQSLSATRIATPKAMCGARSISSDYLERVSAQRCVHFKRSG